MPGNQRKFFFLVPLLLVISACNSQVKSIDRQPSVAGQFYPLRPDELQQTLSDLFSRAVPSRQLGNVVAVMVPHAGYVFSGEVAASGFNQIDAEREYDNVFIIGPSHYVAFEGASVYAAGDYLTPLGRVPVNRELCESLLKRNQVFSARTDAHAREHCIEVQLPFLQKVLKKKFRIVPIVIGAGSAATCKKIADVLRPWMNGRNLFVISSDCSHYPRYDDAVRIDKATADAIVTNSPERLLATLQKNEEANVPNLATSLCGWPAVLTLLYMTAESDAVFTQVEYRNSGDSGLTDKSRVVGYWAIAVSQKGRSGLFDINAHDRSVLLSLARSAINSYLGNGRIPDEDPAAYSDALKTPCGAFVTLNEHGVLRGCIGRFDANEPLYKVVQEMAIASATQDYRFQPVRFEEVKSIEIEISVLTPMRKISSIDDFELGKQGIYMKTGNRSGTFLPQVAKETGWSKEEFLGHCAQDKAGIGWDGWKNAELFVYEAIVFGEK
jgi:AmmeMemoRadiSam system protein B/AmmeMemoRadiSam system protein A